MHHQLLQNRSSKQGPCENETIAIHLKLDHYLLTQAFLGALWRFTLTRGNLAGYGTSLALKTSIRAKMDFCPFASL